MESPRLIERATHTLRPHPTYESLCKATIGTRVERLALEPGPFREPLLITTGGIIIDGYARWRVAMNRKQASVSCIEESFTEQEALLAVIKHHQGSTGLNAFCRILLALELEPLLRLSGLGTASSNLTDARRRDVRPELARAAGVSTGNVTKVKQLLETTIASVRDALIRGQLRIHRAWTWRTQTRERQEESLSRHLNPVSIEKRIARLIKAHVRRADAEPGSCDALQTVLRCLRLQGVEGLTVEVVDLPGKAVVMTRALYDELQARERA